MTTYTVTLSEAENDALAYAAASQQEWIDNLVHDRCRVAVEEIVAIVVQQCLANNVQIPGTKDEIVVLGFTRGWIKTAADRLAEEMSTRSEG
jgi:hypothetical protein